MKKRVMVLIGLALLWFVASAVQASDFSPENGDWLLINRNAKGDLLYLAPADGDSSGPGFKKYWAKVETKSKMSPSPMLFLNEFNCAERLIKRLEVKLYRPDEGGNPQPFRAIAFEGRWDQPSAGIEEYLHEQVCGDASPMSL